MTIFNTIIVTIFNYYYQKANLSTLDVLIPEGNTAIYDRNGIMIGNYDLTFGGYTPYEEIPEVMVKAIIAIEDSHFFTHNGLDYKAIMRALAKNIAKKGYKEGASTITQQLVKNIYLSKEKKLERKINEAILALKLEKVLSKEEILAAYLSNVLYGGKIYGIKMASSYYFNKNVADLTLVEASLLAGMIQMPNYYNPFSNPINATKRRNLVLLRMKEEGFINDEEYQNAIVTDIADYLNEGPIYEIKDIYSSYIEYVIDEVYDELDISLFESKKTVYLMMDSQMQMEVYNIMQNCYETFPDEKMQCGIVILDNQTGGILAIGGSRKTGFKNLNYATNVYNQPGSTIKPILSYAPSFFYLNYMPQTQILDNAISYKTGEQVKNWDYQYKGYISMREALSDSRNIPAIKLYNELGSKAWDFANSVGIYNKDPFFHESMAIGGFANGYSVLEMTNAYIAFPRMGSYIKAYATDKILQNEKTIRLNRTESYVMNKETAYFINSILHDVLKNTSYDLKNYYLSAKTGQSNYDYETRVKYNIPASATKDSWAIGYTKDLTVGVWIGYGFNSGEYYLTRYNKNIAITIMQHLLNKFSNAIGEYEIPIGIKYKTYDVYNGHIYEKSDNNHHLVSDYFYEQFYPLPPLDRDEEKI